VRTPREDSCVIHHKYFIDFYVLFSHSAILAISYSQCLIFLYRFCTLRCGPSSIQCFVLRRYTLASFRPHFPVIISELSLKSFILRSSTHIHAAYVSNAIHPTVCTLCPFPIPSGCRYVFRRGTYLAARTSFSIAITLTVSLPSSCHRRLFSNA